jgi:hypothetical protein
VGTTSAGTRIDFRTSPDGLRVHDFHFGSPLLTCPDGSVDDARMPDGNFPLPGLSIDGVEQGSFSGILQAEDFTPDNADPSLASVTGRFVDPQHVTGTVQELSRGDCGYDPLTFTATRAGSLPATPARGRRYSGLTVDGTRIWFRVSRSGQRVSGFRIARITLDSFCTPQSKEITLARSYPAAGLPPDRNGAFSGVLSSRVTAHGRQAGNRVRVSVLFLSRTEATGTFRLLDPRVGRPCHYEMMPFRANLTG